MRANRFLVAGFAAVALSGAVSAQETDPFKTRNLSPAVAIFGLPVWENIAEAPVFTATAELANHYRLSRRGRDTLILDGETLRFNLGYSRPLGTRWSFSAELPIVQQSGGALDDVVDGWHSAFGLPDGGRNNRPEDELLFQLARDNVPFLTLEDDARGIGDLQVSVARRLGAGDGFVVRAAAKLPTGREEILAGSGAADWSLTLMRPRQVMLGGRAAGYFWGVGWLDVGAPDAVSFAVEDGSLVGILGGSLKVLERIGLKAQIDFYSALYDSALVELGDGAVQITFGGWVDAGERTRLDFAISEDLNVSTAPDVVLHFALHRSFE